MKRTGTGKPVLSWALIVRNASKTLETCLKSLRAMTPDAEIVIVDTMSSDDGKTWAIAEKYADTLDEYAGPNGTWNREMYAFDDAAAARNRSFALCRGDWIGWIDADDELVIPSEAQRLLALNGQLPTVGVSEVKGLKTDEQKNEGKAVLPARHVAGLEDFLATISRVQPDVTGFWCPYLYRFADGEDGKIGKAAEWQKRERIVKRQQSGLVGWKWLRKAHEFLVPEDGSLYAGMKQLPTLLFVHRKEWTYEDAIYSRTRHYNIIRKDYDAGVREFRDLYYLTIFAPTFCPELKGKFLDEMLKYGVMRADRAQAHCMRGQWFAEKGYATEAIESYAAGIAADETYPDNYFGMAQVFEDQERWGKAVEWYMKAVKVPATHLNSIISPREHLVVNRIRGALCALWAARAQPNAAEVYLRAAVEMAEDAMKEPGATLADEIELRDYTNLFRNELRSFEALKKLTEVQQLLIENDESMKAAMIIATIPHNMVDHPLAQRLELHAAKMHRHETDQTAYTEFYEKDQRGTFMDDAGLEKLSTLPRIVFACAELKKLRESRGRPLRVLEVGPWDGVATLPMMKAIPDSHFVAIEVQQRAVDRLLENAKARGLDGRLNIVHGMFGEKTLKEAMDLGSRGGGFDAVVFFEVLEHIPDPTDTLTLLRSALSPGGRLFVSTPWGAYDRGHAPDKDERDSRGHVVALMPDEVVKTLERNGLRVLELGGHHEPGNYSDTMHLMAESVGYLTEVQIEEAVKDGAKRITPAWSPQFVVSHALWPWNASFVEKTGMGASEETIVFLARAFGQRGGSPRVLGPLPKADSLDEMEVRDGVLYLPNSKIRYLKPDRPLVVSREPALVSKLKPVLSQFNRSLPSTRVLWLQDCFYPDMNATTAADYTKIVVLSQKHKEQIARAGVPLEKLKIIPNFLLRDHFPDVPSKLSVKREPHRFIYASSPDRGLIPLLQMWPMIRKHWPDATLGVFYGWQGARRLGSGSLEWQLAYRQIREEWETLKRQDGVEDWGRVNHVQIANEMRRASVWAYPIFNDQVETFCSNAIKARAAGCVPVVTAGMIPDEAIKGEKSLAEFIPDDTKGRMLIKPSGDYEWAFIKACERAIKRSAEERDAMAAESIEKFAIEQVIPRWTDVLSGK